jgi:hypothetical protein
MLVDSKSYQAVRLLEGRIVERIVHLCPVPEVTTVRRIFVSLCAVVVLTLTGCGIGQGQLRQQVFRPGPARYQQERAVKFDPYSEQERYAGPRDSTSRPRDYYQPNPEPTRGRWLDWGAPRFGFE